MKITPILIAAAMTATGSLAVARLGGLGAKNADPKAVKVEMEILAALNKMRKTKSLEPLRMDEQLQAMLREQSERGARGDPAAKTFELRIKTQKLAPHGYRLQYLAGTHSNELLGEIGKDADTQKALALEYADIAIGAFFVPDDPPFFQVAVMVVQKPDPMAGKTGLSPEQTDPVMKEAATTIKKLCYDTALRNNPNLTGNLIFRVVIGGKGNVEKAELISKTGMDVFDACALNAVREFQFPAPYKGKPVTLNHPMRFVPPQGGKTIGRLSPGQVSRVFHTKEQEFKNCYDERQKVKAKLGGTFLLVLTVLPSGKLKSVDVTTDELGDTLLRKCLLGHVNELVFPEPEFGGEATIEFPLKFAPP
ncbi:MAG: hypothetical protein A2341_06890 [Deltaproteobacteria bacterium RIFOXYB12_FULL_58_9]|nr:MAG: hypothetical protein A2341_06890 [Deltaproteobacteria bacterium RIFOXYB12_FULL_58_9]